MKHSQYQVETTIATYGKASKTSDAFIVSAKFGKMDVPEKDPVRTVLFEKWYRDYINSVEDIQALREMLDDAEAFLSENGRSM